MVELYSTRLWQREFEQSLTPRFHRVRLRHITGALRAVLTAIAAIAATLVNGCYSTTRGALQLRSVPEASQKRPRSVSAQGSSKIRMNVRSGRQEVESSEHI